MTALDAFVRETRARGDRRMDAWLDALPGLIDELAKRWELTVGEPFGGGAIGYVVAAERTAQASPTALVLKATFPDESFPEEVASLAAWDGNGAVHLLDSDPRGAMLMERAEPGDPLIEDADEDHALTLAAGVLQRLWRPRPDPAPFMTLAQETISWSTSMPRRHEEAGRPFERALIVEAVDLIAELAPTQGEQVLLHGDLHLGNILDAGGGAWLAIDPKPLVGEREFDVTALIRDKQGHLMGLPGLDAVALLQHRFDLLSEALGCDRRRLRGWSIAVMVDYALWSFETRQGELGAAQAECARLLRTLSS